MTLLRVLGVLEAISAAAAPVLHFFLFLRGVLNALHGEDGIVHAKLEYLGGVAHLDYKLSVLLHEVVDDLVHGFFVSEGTDLLVEVYLAGVVFALTLSLWNLVAWDLEEAQNLYLFVDAWLQIVLVVFAVVEHAFVQHI